VLLYFILAETLEGYVHLISPVTTATKSSTKYFDLKLQTTESAGVRMVCYSPERRQKLQQSQQSKSPVKIAGLVKNKSKRSSCESEEYTILKRAKITAADLEFECDNSLSNRLHTVEEALDASVYETIDLKVKIMMKSENKQPILHGGKTTFKADSIVADETNAIKLVLWEDAIEKIHIGKCYHIENCKVRVFEDSKFLNTNAFTKITEIDQIPNINLTTPHLQDNIVTGQCLGVNIKCTISCLCCNETIEDSQIVEDTVTCSKCNMTVIKDVLQTKVVAQLLMKIDGKMVNYTAFNDAIESFLSNIKCETSLLKITSTELSKLFFSAGEQKVILDQSTRVISQFLPST
jgi:hypothetical protein